MKEILKALGLGIITPEIEEQMRKFIEENPIDPQYDVDYVILDGPIPDNRQMPDKQKFARLAKYILENTEEWLKEFE